MRGRTPARAKAIRCCCPRRAPSGSDRRTHHAYQLQHFDYAPLLLGGGNAARGEPVRHVLRRGHVRKQRVTLEDDAYLAAVRGQIVDALLADHDAARGLRNEARDDAQERGLAAATGAEQCDKFARSDFECDGVDGARLPVAVRDIIHKECVLGAVGSGVGQHGVRHQALEARGNSQDKATSNVEDVVHSRPHRPHAPRTASRGK